MKKRMVSLAMLLCSMGMFSGCTQEEVDLFFDTVSMVDEALNSETEPQSEPITETETTAQTTVQTTAQTTVQTATEARTESATEAATTVKATEAATETATDAQLSESNIVWGESYTTAEDVAEYIYLYGELPENFITKKEAGKLGWESSEGNLWEVAPGMSIGGDHFGNYEGILPEGNYHECDINYDGGYRGAERIIFGDDGSVYYTDDHYETFTRLY